MTPRTLTRQDMYDLVWSKPMTQLATEFEWSDVGLRKICKAAKVPTPGLGYWAKLANGKKVTKTELPTLYPFQSQPAFHGGRLWYLARSINGCIWCCVNGRC